MKLITTEKKSVAEDIGKVLGINKNKGDYFEGNGYLICWAAGHLVGLAEPEAYGYMSKQEMWDKEHPENQQTALNQLPLMPEEYKLVVLPDKSAQKQFKIMKNLMHREDVDEIIDCGDAGPEGHILQWFIRVKAGCKKHVRRCILTDMSESAIRTAFANLQPIEKYKNVVKGEFCKKKADWALGMSASRAASITYKSSITVGRVQSPTLYFVVERFLRNRNFKTQTYYTIEAAFDGFTAKWQKDTDNILSADVKDESGRVLDKAAIERLVGQIRGSRGEIILLETKKKKRDRPQLYDTMQLTKDAIKLYGYTGDEVLNAAEELYNTHKITTYPRTDSVYITEDLAPEMQARIADISTIEQYSACANKVLQDGLNLGKKIVDGSKVEDHHAIITTTNLKGYDLSKLSDIEKNVLHLIITRMIESFSGAYKYEETTVQIRFDNGLIFKNSVKVPV
ncbi:MAG TPA: DNA topoisomerase III, partial [Ruminococcus sp.]|nr:DNA topoisomerase III [Ruminococcus sp.]